jgi:hypothetical protein
VSVFGFIAAKKAAALDRADVQGARGQPIRVHAWQARKPSVRALEDRRLTDRIREIHEANRRVYGSPRVHAELVLGDGERLGRKRVEGLMRQAGISGLVPRRRGGSDHQRGERGMGSERHRRGTARWRTT